MLGQLWFDLFERLRPNAVLFFVAAKGNKDSDCLLVRVEPQTLYLLALLTVGAAGAAK